MWGARWIPPAWREALEDAASRIRRLRRSWRERDFRRAFCDRYQELRALAREPDHDGFVVVAAGPPGIEGAAWLRTQPGEITTAILGRHGHCDIVSEAADVSLRHLALIVHRHQAGGATTVLRLVDLRTPTGLVDEHGRSWPALETDGPLVVRCASRVVMAFPTGPAGPGWPPDAERAWSALPPRVYREAGAEHGAAASTGAWSAHDARGAGRDPEATLVRTLPGPRSWRRSLLADGEQPRGELQVRSAEGEARLVVGATALARGILLGRESRCHNDGVPVLRDDCVSRVHALVIAVAGAVHIVDAASKNGLRLGRRPVRSAALADGCEVALASGIAWVRWRSIH